MRPGLRTSIDAAYTPGELRRLVDSSRLSGARIEAKPIGVTIRGMISKERDAHAG
jgi:hypothetical protein